jgi:Xaa-Pro aminopeptidase
MKQRPEQQRIRELKLLMKEESVRALLVTRREDVRYLTGFTGSAGSVLVASGRPCLITDFRYKTQAAIQTSGIAVQIQKKDFPSALQDAAYRAGARTIWFDESSVTIDALKKLRRQALAFRGHGDLVGELRRRKDRAEIRAISRAVSRAEESFRELKQYIRPGAREQDLALMLEFLMRGKSAKKAAFDSIIASGRNGAMPHAGVTNRRIRQGDLVTFDFGAEADGYYSDMTRTYCIGSPTARQREIHGLVQAAQSAAIKAARPGISCKAVDAVARDMIREAGHGEHFGHGTGHGIGLMVHEAPSLSPLSKDTLETNMVFTVEPGVYVPGWGGVRIEDMLLMTPRGPKVLTSLPREIDGLKKL